MATFTIDADNHITAFDTPQEAGRATDKSVQQFTTEHEFAKITADWPLSRFIATWNNFAGVVPFTGLRPVKKFTDRRTAVGRIWKEIQRLATPPAQTPSKVATKKPKPKKGSTRSKKTAGARDGSKKDLILKVLERPEGVTLKQIMAKTGWQAHTVRGFISIVKRSVKVQSFKTDDKERAYRIPN